MTITVNLTLPPLTAADFAGWHRVEAEIRRCARAGCAMGCDHRPKNCRECRAENHPEWRRDATRELLAENIHLLPKTGEFA